MLFNFLVMEPTKSGASSFLRFLRGNWLKLFFIGLLLYVALKRELSFQINLKSPAIKEDRISSPPVANPKKEKFSDRAAPANYSSAPESSRNLFEFFSRPGKTSDDLLRALDRIPKEEQISYLKRFARVAISERKKFNIPSSVILANALLNSSAGRNTAANKHNNHFNLQCTKDWEGATATENGICYRKYDNAWASFRDFSIFLSSEELGVINHLDVSEVEAWAFALEQHNLTPIPHLAEKLLALIDLYQLEELDKK